MTHSLGHHPTVMVAAVLIRKPPFRNANTAAYMFRLTASLSRP